MEESNKITIKTHCAHGDNSYYTNTIIKRITITLDKTDLTANFNMTEAKVQNGEEVIFSDVNEFGTAEYTEDGIFFNFTFAQYLATKNYLILMDHSMIEDLNLFRYMDIDFRDDL